MKCLLLCAVVSLSWAAFAQNLKPSTNEKSLPDSASTSKVAAENAETPFVVRPVPIRPPLRIEAGPGAEKRHVADRNFMIVSLFQIGATIGDIESTHYGLWPRHEGGVPSVLAVILPVRRSTRSLCQLRPEWSPGVIDGREVRLIPGAG